MESSFAAIGADYVGTRDRPSTIPSVTSLLPQSFSPSYRLFIPDFNRLGRVVRDFNRLGRVAPNILSLILQQA